jgi:hypothetical protein
MLSEAARRRAGVVAGLSWALLGDAPRGVHAQDGADGRAVLQPARFGVSLELPRGELDGAQRGGVGLGVEVGWGEELARGRVRFRYAGLGLVASPEDGGSDGLMQAARNRYAADVVAGEVGMGLSVPLMRDALRFEAGVFAGVQRWDVVGRAGRVGLAAGVEASLSLLEALDVGVRAEASGSGPAGGLHTVFVRVELELLLVLLGELARG